MRHRKSSDPQASALQATLRELHSHSRPDQLAGMARFGLTGEGRLGVRIPVLRELARRTGPDHGLAVLLQRTGIPDAQILASMVAEPGRMTPALMHRWAADFRAWDVCDQTCLNLFVHTPHAWMMVRRWNTSSREFVRRAAFALLACLAVHDRRSPDERFLRALALVKRASSDERNFVKKSVNWALRAIGKRNAPLRAAALRTAEEIEAAGAPSARWIARDAIRELSARRAARRGVRP